MVAGARQLKVGLRVADLERSCDLYSRLGFRRVPDEDGSGVRYLSFGHTTDLDAVRRLWEEEGLPVTLEPEDVGWARVFHGLDHGGYEVMVEQFT